VLSLVPSTFLRIRSDDDESSSSSSESSEDDECIELEVNSDGSTLDENPWSYSPLIAQFGLLTISFGIGYLFGRRTKP
jgi:hypothetical protein